MHKSLTIDGSIGINCPVFLGRWLLDLIAQRKDKNAQ